MNVAIVALVGLAAGQAVARAAPVLPQQAAQPTPVFDGSSLEGWVNVNGAPDTWTVRDGTIVCSGHPTGVLRTGRMYENFVFEVEWRHLHAGGNAGIFVWSDPLTAPGQPFTRSIEVQVLDGTETKDYTSHGDLFSIHGATCVPDRPHPSGWARCLPSEKRAKPSPEWNRYVITARAGRIELEVNGKVVSAVSQCSPRKGYLCLESEGSEVHFRNLKLTELPATQPPLAAEQIAAPDPGFTSLFNGKDLAGWRETPEKAGHWQVHDWVLAYDGQGDHLWSEQEYGDFVLIADWRWSGKSKKVQVPDVQPDGSVARNADGSDRKVEIDEAGDSGIYLRGNDKSQVNIWCWPIGSGEVYGYRTDAKQTPQVRAGVTPRRKADAPLGEWNRFVITMKGDRLTVVLNGETVLENAELPGVPPKGRIALQHHGAPIEFANIHVRRID